MSERWNVVFMKNGQPMGDTQTVEADDPEQARFVAQHMYPELHAKSEGMLIMEEIDDLNPMDSLQHLGNIWDELHQMIDPSNVALVPRWDNLSGPARAAFTEYMRESPLELIMKTVVKIHMTVSQTN